MFLPLTMSAHGPEATSAYPVAVPALAFCATEIPVVLITSMVGTLVEAWIKRMRASPTAGVERSSVKTLSFSFLFGPYAPTVDALPSTTETEALSIGLVPGVEPAGTIAIV